MTNKFQVQLKGVFILLIFSISVSIFAQKRDSMLTILPGEGWWGGSVNQGHIMPFGKKDYSLNLLGTSDGNQTVAFLLSNTGRYVWSEKPFQFSFKGNSLQIDKTHGDVIYGKSGSTLKDAYAEASKKFFPSSGKWPDSLLVTAPQYNLWIELLYNPNQKDVLAYANTVVEKGWPVGVLMIDDNWTNYYGQFDFDKSKFPDPKAMIAKLHSMGYKVMLWISPFVTADSPTYRELRDKKLLFLDKQGNKDAKWSEVRKPFMLDWWNGYSAHLDLTNPKAIEWLQGRLDYLQSEYGVDGYKLDAGDADFFNDPNILTFKKATPVEIAYGWNELGLKYPLNEYRACWKMGGQPLVQRLRDKYHTWEDVAKLIPHTFVQQLFGFTFTCPDMIGGGDFSSFLPGGTLDPKLLVRSAQCAALMPMMQFSVAPWRVLDSTHFAAVSKVVKLRQQKIQYIMQVLRNSAATGEPAFRSLEYQYPNQGYMNVNDQFLIGDNLMVAPVITPNDTREVIIPKGTWKYKNQVFKGPSKKMFTVALDELLYFEKVK